MKTKQITEKTGLSKDTIRFYEKEKLIPTPSRSANGYRDYDEKVIEQLNMITMAKELGFTLKEIKELTQLLYSNALTKSEMATKLSEKSFEIKTKIAELMKIQALIDNVLVGACEYKNKLV